MKSNLDNPLSKNNRNTCNIENTAKSSVSQSHNQSFQNVNDPTSNDLLPISDCASETLQEIQTDIKTQHQECKINFYKNIFEGPTYVCSCCHQTWFRHSVHQVTNLRLTKEASELFRKCSTDLKSVEQLEWVCRTCITDIRKGQVLRISVANKVSFPNKQDVLNLYDLEERLLSPRIPFMQIRELPTGGQFSIKGSVVNVPVDVMPIVTALPRQLTAMHTIPVALKKRLSFSSSV
ncbi:hypothetical protein HOLleu_10604 [Holothuria leucospilota]|uniref:DUF6570 domain-containing protein n=1 Tax=Holothuria leucospilota TaxID=206669 RepID=A0A9Q1CDT3_HOLLE|nr:hypothetical protein HOLleu_10604 [Holothuria leucospilota]